MTYQEALAYLEQASSFGIKPGLERITALMEALGNPQEDYKIVHVTGTNGKGSVTSYISYALFTSGLRVGRFTSPHLQSYTCLLYTSYGFAKTNKGNRNLWSSFIADYILHSERLMLLCLLIDGRHPEMPIDKVAYDWLVEAGVPLQIVVTKADKLTAKEKSANLAKIKEMYPTDTPPILYSSLKHTGRELLQQRINTVLVGDEA